MGDDPVSRKQVDEIADRLAGFKDLLENFELVAAPKASAEVEDKQ